MRRPRVVQHTIPMRLAARVPEQAIVRADKGVFWYCGAARKGIRRLERDVHQSSKSRGRWRLRVQRRWMPYLFVAPAAITLFFGLAPLVFSLSVSFVSWEALDGMAAFEFVGLENYRWVIAVDDWFGQALFQTLWLLIVGSFFVQASAISLAYFVHRYLGRYLRALVGVYFLPLLVPSVAFIFVFKMLFAIGGQELPTIGVVSALLIAAHDFSIGGVQPLAWLFPAHSISWWRYMDAIWAFSMWLRFTGWNMMWYVAALMTMPVEQSEAARLDGAKPWQELLYVTLPALRPTVFFACSVSFVSAMVDIGSVGEYMHWLAFQIGDFGATSAIAIIVYAILAVAVWILWRFICGRPDTLALAPQGVEMTPAWQPAAPPVWERPLGRFKRWLLAPAPADARLRGFDGVRATACLLVVYHHLCQRIDVSMAIPWVLQPLISLGWKSDAGVCLFFVLSGALLSHPFWTRYLDGGACPSLRAYAVRRFARIAPAYWLALAVSVAGGLIWFPTAQHVAERAAAGAFFVSALHYVSFFPAEMDPTLWSISLEVLCYILLPLLLWPLWRVGRTREPRRVARYLVAVLIGLQLAHFVIVGVFMTDRVDKGWAYGMIGGAKEWLPYWSPASFMTQFMLGSCAAFAIAWRARAPRPIAADEHDQMALWALAAAAFVFAFLGQMGVPSLLTRQPYVTPILPALVALLLYHVHFSATTAAVLDNRIFRYVSRISFGVYLWHWPVMELLRTYAVPTFRMSGVTSGTTWLLLAAAVLGLSCLLASLSWHCLEQPILRWARRGEDVLPNTHGQRGLPAG